MNFDHRGFRFAFRLVSSISSFIFSWTGCTTFCQECHFFIFKSKSSFKRFSRALLPRSVEKRPRGLEIEIKLHSRCNRLYLKKIAVKRTNKHRETYGQAQGRSGGHQGSSVNRRCQLSFVGRLWHPRSPLPRCSEKLKVLEKNSADQIYTCGQGKKQS